jgi:hypothetical protein
MFALSINAYFLGQAIFQVALTRYAVVASLSVMLFAFCFVLTTCQWLGSGLRGAALLGRRRPREEPPQADVPAQAG